MSPLEVGWCHPHHLQRHPQSIFDAMLALSLALAKTTITMCLSPLLMRPLSLRPISLRPISLRLIILLHRLFLTQLVRAFSPQHPSNVKKISFDEALCMKTADQGAHSIKHRIADRSICFLLEHEKRIYRLLERLELNEAISR